ncbi:uncharacterized protein LOC143031235 [Oratosquilla oratoria]|uniref:uncharacterized protein LOC143031235 n=1 Tax=Oratosquilla oratoria TaxID=337810 RepID=UPI003F7689DA
MRRPAEEESDCGSPAAECDCGSTAVAAECDRYSPAAEKERCCSSPAAAAEVVDRFCGPAAECGDDCGPAPCGDGERDCGSGQVLLAAGTTRARRRADPSSVVVC